MISHNLFHWSQRPTSFLAVVSLIVSLAATPVFADDLPKRKSGLWEIKISSSESPGSRPTIQTCIDEKVDNLLAQDDDAVECAKPHVRRDGARLIIDSVCKSDETTMKGQTVMTGNFDSAYRAEVKVTYDPPIAGMREGSSVIEARWLGPCKPGQSHGDVVLPQMNLRPGGGNDR